MSQPTDPPMDDPEYKSGLGEVATKLLVLCVPWPEQWAIYGAWIVSAPTDKKQDRFSKPQPVTDMDRLGNEILSYIPQHFVDDFLSEEGQSIVSLFYRSPTHTIT